MKKITTITLLFSFFLFSGCWGGGKYKGEKYIAVESIPEGKALVYIYRPYKFAGSALHYKINNLEERICDIGLYNDSYIVYFSDPGKCEFWTLKPGSLYVLWTGFHLITHSQTGSQLICQLVAFLK